MHLLSIGNVRKMVLWDIRIVMETDEKDRSDFRKELHAVLESDFKARIYELSPNKAPENDPYYALKLQLFETNNLIVQNKALQKTYPEQKTGLLISLTTLKQMKEMLEKQLGNIEDSTSL